MKRLLILSIAILPFLGSCDKDNGNDEPEPVSQLGNGSIAITASELQPGMYIYTLAVDGQEADSKRMIITEE